ILGQETVRVNSLHGQGILEPGERVVVEGVAEDGTIEAIRIADAPGFALGVQWHAEYDPQRNPINAALFRAFGEALAAQRRGAWGGGEEWMVGRPVTAVARVGALVVGVLLLMGLSSPPAGAQVSSGKPIRIIIPFGPAGSADVIARVLQQPLGQAL